MLEGTLCLILIISTCFPGIQSSGTKVDVIDLRGKDLKVRLLVLSLQGIVNRRGPLLYVLWEGIRVEPTPSERWLKYYEDKGWIGGFKHISLTDAIRKYREFLNGFVIYDPELPATINLAVSLAGVENLTVAHPDFKEMLEESGLELKYDLRGLFDSKDEVHRWMLENVFPHCNKSLINLFPTFKAVIVYRVSIIDYVIENRACSIGLSVDEDSELIGEFYSRMDKFAIVIGYPEDSKFERPWVSLTSKYGLINVLATAIAPNFSFHSKMPRQGRYIQDHRFEFEVDNGKIYVAFVVSDLGLNVMQSFYYEMWLSDKRGEIPIGWWLDAITMEICPGILQYYYETKSSSDYFYSAHVAGRIRASDFPYLEEYLNRGQKYLDRCSLKVVGFSNHKKKDEKVLKLYSEVLDVEGFLFGFGPEFEDEYWVVDGKVWIIPRYMGDPDEVVKAIDGYVESTDRRPLFIVIGIGLWYYPTIEQVVEIKDQLQEKYGDEIVFCRVDELIGAAKKSLSTSPSRDHRTINARRIIQAFLLATFLSILLIWMVKSKNIGKRKYSQEKIGNREYSQIFVQAKI